MRRSALPLCLMLSVCACSHSVDDRGGQQYELVRDACAQLNKQIDTLTRAEYQATTHAVAQAHRDLWPVDAALQNEVDKECPAANAAALKRFQPPAPQPPKRPAGPAPLRGPFTLQLQISGEENHVTVQIKTSLPTGATFKITRARLLDRVDENGDHNEISDGEATSKVEHGVAAATLPEDIDELDRVLQQSRATGFEVNPTSIVDVTVYLDPDVQTPAIQSLLGPAAVALRGTPGAMMVGTGTTRPVWAIYLSRTLRLPG